MFRESIEWRRETGRGGIVLLLAYLWLELENDLALEFAGDLSRRGS